MYEVKRDFCGYGAHPPDPKWPGGARIAVNFVMNYEEGSEPSVGDGEARAVVESVKAASDVFAPVAGTVTEVNQAIIDFAGRLDP